MVEDIQGQTGETGGGINIERTLVAKGVDYATFADWERLNNRELERGGSKGKIREKFTDVGAMMDCIRRLR
jgi:hypothetical protein